MALLGVFKPVTDWMAGRAYREQALLLAGGVALVGYLGYSFLWLPLHTEREALRARIGQLDHAMAVLSALPGAAPVVADARPMATILTETARDFDLSIRRIDASAQGADVSLDEASFDSLIQWLDALENDHGLHLTALDVAQRPSPGQVSATLTVTGAAP